VAYGDQLGFETVGGRFYLEDRYPIDPLGAYYEATLNDFGKSLILAGDYSGFCLRTRGDVENTGGLFGAGEVNKMIHTHSLDTNGYDPELVFSNLRIGGNLADPLAKGVFI